MTRTWWQILLAIFLAIYAILAITSVQIDHVNFIQGALAAATAICLLLNK